MREAALELSHQRDDYAETLARKLKLILASPFIALRDAWELSKFCNQLATLNQRQLNDIGITCSDIDQLRLSGERRADALARIMEARRSERWSRVASRN